VPTVELVTDGTATGNPHYLVFDPKAEPWVGNIRDIIDDTDLDLDTTPVFLLTRQNQVVAVHVESTDEDPDWLDWEVTLVEGGELVERVELNGGDGGWANPNRTINVNGF
jgi:hypothetical protein